MSSDVDFEYGWIEAAFQKRRANLSNIACFETSDPIRTGQIVAYLTQRGEEIFSYDPWSGLRKLNLTSEVWDPVKPPAAGSYDNTVPADFANLSEVLRHIEHEMKVRSVFFVLKNIDAAREDGRNETLINALRAWSTDPQIAEAGSLAVLICGSAASVLDPFTTELAAVSAAPLASDSERSSVIDTASKDLGAGISEIRDQVVIATAGLGLHQTRSLLIECFHREGRFPIEEINTLKAEYIRANAAIEIAKPDPLGFKAVGGYEPVKNFVSDYIIRVLADPARATQFGIPLPRGLLLYGPPGTGKTLFARALASEIKLNFLIVRADEIFKMYLGQSGQSLRQLIERAEQIRGLVFIDEIDRFGARSGGGSDGASQETRRLFNQLLEWLGDHSRKSIIVGATNRPEDLDDAFVRPGRFDYKIPFLYPDEEARRQIVEIHLGLTGAKPRPPLDLSPDELKATISDIVSSTDNFSGAEIEELVIRAKRLAFASNSATVSRDHFRDARKRFAVNPEKRSKERERYLNQAAEFTDDAAFLSELRDERQLLGRGAFPLNSAPC